MAAKSGPGRGNDKATTAASSPAGTYRRVRPNSRGGAGVRAGAERGGGRETDLNLCRRKEWAAATRRRLGSMRLFQLLPARETEPSLVRG